MDYRPKLIELRDHLEERGIRPIQTDEEMAEVKAAFERYRPEDGWPDDIKLPADAELLLDRMKLTAVLRVLAEPRR